METMQNINMKWIDSYLFGIPVIDRQHKKFLGIYDDVANLINTREQSDNAKINKVICEMIKYSKVHLPSEEKLIKLAGYPDADSHIRQHELFKKKTDEFTISYKYKHTFLLENLFVFMKKWYLGHVLQTDTEYIDYVKLFLEENPD